MTLKELKNIFASGKYDIPDCDEVYIDMDDNTIEVGFSEADADGMRMLASDDVDDYGTLEDLINDNCNYFISDGLFDIDVPEGEPTELAIDIDDFQVLAEYHVLGEVDEADLAS